MTVLTSIPSARVREQWEFLTDVIKVRNGLESRLSLREDPRVTLYADFPVITQAQRSKFVNYIMNNISEISVIPIWPYLSRINEEAASGTSTLEFDIERVPVAVGGQIVLINEKDQIFLSYEVATLTSDGCTITETLDVDVDGGFYAVLGMDCLIQEGVTNSIETVTSEFSFRFVSWNEIPLARSGSSVTLNTFDDLILLERRPLGGKTEVYETAKEIQDNETGKRALVVPENHIRIANNMEFIVKRFNDPEDMDYWRLFFSETRGAWKPFLLSTHQSDFNLAATPAQAATSIEVDEITIDPDLLEFETYKRIEIEYEDKTVSVHTITAVTISGTMTMAITPALPDDPKVTSITRISHLLKMRGADTVGLSHGSFATVISFDAVTAD